MTRPKTKILVDGGDPQDTRQVKELLAFVDGQTTNPSLIAKNPHIKELIASGHRRKWRNHGRDTTDKPTRFQKWISDSRSRRWQHDIGPGERRSIGSGPDNGNISFGIGHTQQQPHARPRIDWKPSRTMRGTMISAAAASAHEICQIAFNPMPTRAIHDR
jgi:hypothetical protein